MSSGEAGKSGGGADRHILVVTYIALSLAVFAVFLSLAERYVASLISLAAALVLLSFAGEKRCRG